MLLWSEEHEREKTAQRLRLQLGLGFGLTQALALLIASPDMNDSELTWLLVGGGATFGMLTTRRFAREASIGQMRTARTFHRIGTIFAAQLYWIGDSEYCRENSEDCGGRSIVFGGILSAFSLAAASAGISFAKNHPNLREEEPLRYQHGMYWGIIGGTLASIPNYNENTNEVTIASMIFGWGIAGLMLGSVLNKMDLFTAHEIIVMSELGIIGVISGITIAEIVGNNASISALYSIVGGGIGMAYGHSFIHNNPDSSFGRFGFLAIAPNSFEHGEGHRVSGLTISGSF